MYRFLKYNATYTLTDKVSCLDGSVHVFSCDYPLRAKYDTLSGCYMFTFCCRENISLNGSVPANAMDIFMQQMGDILFPITIMADKFGEILSIKDYDLFKSRWEQSVNIIMDEYKHSIYISNYIEMSRRLLQSHDTFISTLLRNPFFRYFFFKSVDSQYTLYCFPSATDECILSISILKSLEEYTERYGFSDSLSTEGNLWIKKDRFDLIDEGIASFNHEIPDVGHITKEIRINVTPESREVSQKSWFTM